MAKGYEGKDGSLVKVTNKEKLWKRKIGEKSELGVTILKEEFEKWRERNLEGQSILAITINRLIIKSIKTY